MQLAHLDATFYLHFFLLPAFFFLCFAHFLTRSFLIFKTFSTWRACGREEGGKNKRVGGGGDLRVKGVVLAPNGTRTRASDDEADGKPALRHGSFLHTCRHETRNDMPKRWFTTDEDSCCRSWIWPSLVFNFHSLFIDWLVDQRVPLQLSSTWPTPPLGRRLLVVPFFFYSQNVGHDFVEVKARSYFSRPVEVQTVMPVFLFFQGERAYVVTQ